jgi:molybdate transport system substrate-binding protein
MQSVLEDLGPKFEHATGHKLALTFATGGATVKRVQSGEVVDVVITLRQGINIVVKDGKAPAGNVTALASAGISVAIRKGAPKPDISSPDALGSATDAEAATALVNSLRTPEAAAVIKAKGMEPATR